MLIICQHSSHVLSSIQVRLLAGWCFYEQTRGYGQLGGFSKLAASTQAEHAAACDMPEVPPLCKATFDS